jgi:hypothetical protein
MFEPRLALCLLLFWPLAGLADTAFVVRTVEGKEYTGPLVQFSEDGSLQLGQKGRRKLGPADWIALRQVGQVLPPLPTDEHVVLANGDRLPGQVIRLQDEILTFKCRDLNDGKEVSLPLTTVLLLWRLPPDRTVDAERYRQRLIGTRRSGDLVVLRNGDTIQGTLQAVNAGKVEVEVGKKTVSIQWPQVSTLALNSELLENRPLAGFSARLTLLSGARITLQNLRCDGETWQGKTAFGAALRGPVAQVVEIERLGDNLVELSSLKPAGYESTPYLNERWPWLADRSVFGRDLRLGGSTYSRGLGMHADSRLRFDLGGSYRRFSALVGLDDRDGRGGQVRLRVRIDGKVVAEVGKAGLLTHADGPQWVNVDLNKARELTLEVVGAPDPVQGAVNWVQAVLVK